MKAEWIVRTNDFKEGALNAQVIECNESDRIMKAVKNLFIFIGAAIVCVFIPVLHFFLVPTALILGAVYSYKGFKYRQRIESGSFTCPECQKNTEIKNLWFEFTTRCHCINCATQVVIINKSATT